VLNLLSIIFVKLRSTKSENKIFLLYYILSFLFSPFSFNSSSHHHYYIFVHFIIIVLNAQTKLQYQGAGEQHAAGTGADEGSFVKKPSQSRKLHGHPAPKRQQNSLCRWMKNCPRRYMQISAKTKQNSLCRYMLESDSVGLFYI
jgi:hypothetical protein